MRRYVIHILLHKFFKLLILSALFLYTLKTKSNFSAMAILFAHQSIYSLSQTKMIVLELAVENQNFDEKIFLVIRS
jgi:hypothetical protein